MHLTFTNAHHSAVMKWRLRHRLRGKQHIAVTNTWQVNLTNNTRLERGCGGLPLQLGLLLMSSTHRQHSKGDNSSNTTKAPYNSCLTCKYTLSCIVQSTCHGNKNVTSTGGLWAVPVAMLPVEDAFFHKNIPEDYFSAQATKFIGLISLKQSPVSWTCF